MLITFLASFLIWILFAGLFVLWIIDGKIKREEVLHGIIAFTFAWVLADILKNFFPTTRPFILSGELPLVLFPAHDGAFPSGHTASSFALALTIFRHDRKVGAVYLALALLIGVARIMARVHYPVDILGGMVLGALVSGLVSKMHLPH